MYVPCFCSKTLTAVLACSAVLLTLATSCTAEEDNALRLVNIDAETLAHTKQQLVSGKATTTVQTAYDRLLQQANISLKASPESVIQKSFMPPSGDMQDYLSLSRYWWPNENTQDGLPWVRRDGQTNPDTQNDKVDRPRLGRMAKHAATLSLAYYFSNDEHYAAHASAFIRTWFITEKTRMNPHLNYAQTVPGNPKPRRSGILDGRLIPLYVLDAIELIRGSGYWSDTDEEAMQIWLTQYNKWIVKSKVGKQGSQAKNNHGSWYYFQVAALADYLDDDKQLQYAIKQTQKLLGSQFKDTGAQPEELARTRTFSYSCFNLDALSHIAFITEKHGHSLWQWPSSKDSVIQQGINYVTPAIMGEDWPHQTPGVDPTHCIRVLALSKAATGHNEKALQRVFELIAAGNTSHLRDYYRLVLTQPVL